MIATNLKKVLTKRKKRIGRGFGSGKGGHTVGRGQKGQKSRGGYHERNSETSLKKLIRRIGKFEGIKSRQKKKKAVKISLLLSKQVYKISKEEMNKFVSGDVVLVGSKEYKDFDLSKVEVAKDVAMTNTLKSKILEAGGKVDAE